METSGETRTFASGAIRDGASKKPMLQLISPYFLMDLGEWLRAACVDRDPPYPPRNWEKGMPFSETIGSMERHLQKIKMGSTAEDHAAAIGFGTMALAHYRHEIAAGRMDPALDDMPKYEQQDPVYVPPGKGIRVSSEGRCSVDNGCLDCSSAESCELLQHDLARRADKGGLLNDRESNLLLGYTYLGPNGVPKAYVKVVAPPQKLLPTGPIPSRKPRVYITGPMSGLPAYNFSAFDGARDLAIVKGFDPTSPADLDREHGVDPINDPGSAERCHEADPKYIQTLVERDALVILGLNPAQGDGLALLPGWENSVGAKAEIFLARWKGLHFYDACTYEDITGHTIACLDNISTLSLDASWKLRHSNE